MILRRVIEHFRKQEWTAIFIDFAIVVLGVFVGTQVSNWNASRIAAGEAQAYLVRIEDDIRQNRHELDLFARYYRQTLRHGERALAGFGAPPETLGGQFLIDLYQTTQIAPRSARRDSYDEFLASGVVDKISVELRRRLANYYVNDEGFTVVIGNIPPYRERIRTVLPLDAQRAVRAACAEVIGMDADGGNAASLPEHCAIDLAEDATQRAVAAALSAPGLAADLSRHVADLDQKVEIFDLMAGRIDDLSRFIAEQRP